ncbi:DUF3592 domain-containing protein [Streptomyces purpureus]|uniref:DUF3592 domain-containing protein n=1 Tax=Streptomyces purpureus TaxID=1951 RepID=A0A918HDG1_9ACTN|nr:DUF3592 domain-containing protein [Streptomyces purpureus]GGT52688.1 hypothetical protein GCM10014713_53240 [Streptomyces purpureus]
MRVAGGEYLLYGFLAAFFGFIAVRYALRLTTVVRTLRRGVRTTGECVRIRRPHSDSDVREYHFAFRTEDGRTVEFEDFTGWAMRTGTAVTVTYDPAAPERTATIAGRGSWSPVLSSAALVAGCGLGFLVFTTVLLYEIFG